MLCGTVLAGLVFSPAARAAQSCPANSALMSASMQSAADSALKPAAIPIINRPPFRFEAGHHSNQ